MGAGLHRGDKPNVLLRRRRVGPPPIRMHMHRTVDTTGKNRLGVDAKGTWPVSGDIWIPSRRTKTCWRGAALACAIAGSPDSLPSVLPATPGMTFTPCWILSIAAAPQSWPPGSWPLSTPTASRDADRLAGRLTPSPTDAADAQRC
jgi:hypothetical protein